jgi:hypothetical protein
MGSNTGAKGSKKGAEGPTGEQWGSNPGGLYGYELAVYMDESTDSVILA